MTLTRTVMVEMTFTIPVEVPLDYSDDAVQFEVEENSCPYTRCTGASFDALRKKHEEASTCWACTVNAKQKLVGDWKKGDGTL